MIATWVTRMKTLPAAAGELLARHRTEEAGAAPEDPVPVWEDEVRRVEELLTARSRPAVVLDPVEERRRSRIGGAPDLPEGTDWPRDDKGRPLNFLMQIDYAEMPPLGDFPAEGVLSVFVGCDDLYGCDFPSRLQHGYRTWYFAADVALSPADSPLEERYDPANAVLREAPVYLAGRLAESAPAAGCREVDAILSAWPGAVPDSVWARMDELFEIARPGSIYYGGHPCFTKQDIRREDSGLEVLLQVGSLGFPGGGRLSWGDWGEANFFLHPELLAAGEMEKAIYNWDCA